MTEQNEGLSDILSKVSTLDELKSAIPSRIIDKFGTGEKGVNNTIGFLRSFIPFVPEPFTFGRGVFNDTVAVNYETGELLPPDEQQKMLDAALESGFMQKVEGKERYSVKKELQDAIVRVVGEE